LRLLEISSLIPFACKAMGKMFYSFMFFIVLLNLTTALRPINVAVIAKTDGDNNADSDTGEFLKLNINGNWREAPFPDLPGNDYMKHKSDWFEWPASQFSGFDDLDDLEGIRIRAGGNDGWKYEDISVFIEDENGNWHAVAMHFEVNAWVDGDGSVKERTVSMNVQNWKQCLATGHIVEVQLFAATEGWSDAGSDDGAFLIIKKGSHEVSKKLDNLDGDDYQKHKTDWWTWSWSTSWKTTDISEIKLRSGGSDGWDPERAMVVFKTQSGQYQVLSLDRSVKFLDERDETHLNLIYCPFEYTDTVGYWGRYATGNGGSNSLHAIRYSFERTSTDTLSQAESQERFRSTTDTTTIGVETGLEFEGLSASAKSESSIENTNSVTKRREVEISISNSISQSTDYEHEARPPPHIPSGEHYALYVWNVFRKSNFGGGANLISFDYIFKWGACRDVYPNCVTSSACADDDCMTCTTADAVIDPNFTGVRQACRPPEGHNIRCPVHDNDWNCCTTENPCGDGEGDCDSDSHCRDQLVCLHNTHGDFDTCGEPGGRRSLQNTEHRRLIEQAQ